MDGAISDSARVGREGVLGVAVLRRAQVPLYFRNRHQAGRAAEDDVSRKSALAAGFHANDTQNTCRTDCTASAASRAGYWRSYAGRRLTFCCLPDCRRRAKRSAPCKNSRRASRRSQHTCGRATYSRRKPTRARPECLEAIREQSLTDRRSCTPYSGSLERKSSTCDLTA